MDYSPPKLPCPRDSPDKNTGVGCHFLLQGIFLTQGLNLHFRKLLHCRRILYRLRHQCVCVSRSVVSDSATPWTVAHQAPLSTGFSRQEYWSGLLFPSPGDLPDPGTEPVSYISCIAGGFFTTEPPGKPKYITSSQLMPWRRKWQPTPVFLPGEFYGQRSLVGYSPWGCKELDMTERLTNTSRLVTNLGYQESSATISVLERIF